MWLYPGFLTFSLGWLGCLVSFVVPPWTVEKVPTCRYLALEWKNTSTACTIVETPTIWAIFYVQMLSQLGPIVTL